MANKHKAAKPGGELIRNAKEISKVEQYWHLAGRPAARIPPKDYHYVEELAHLQFELIKLQEWVRLHGLKFACCSRGATFHASPSFSVSIRRWNYASSLPARR